MSRVRGVVLLAVGLWQGCGCTEIGCESVVAVTIGEALFDEGEWVWTSDLPDATEDCRVVIGAVEETTPTVTDSCQRWEASIEGGAVVMRAYVPMREVDEHPMDVEIGWGPSGADPLLELVELPWSEIRYPNGKRCDEGRGCRSAEVALER